MFVEVKYFLSRSIPTPTGGEATKGGEGIEKAARGAVLPRPGAGFTRGRESFAKTFPLINLVYRWAGSGDACALRSRQNLKYEQLSKFTRDATADYVPRPRNCERVPLRRRPTSIIGKKRALIRLGVRESAVEERK